MTTTDRHQFDHLHAAPRSEERIDHSNALDQFPHVADVTGDSANFVNAMEHCYLPMPFVVNIIST